MRFIWLLLPARRAALSQIVSSWLRTLLVPTAAVSTARRQKNEGRSSEQPRSSSVDGSATQLLLQLTLHTIDSNRGRGGRKIIRQLQFGSPLVQNCCVGEEYVQDTSKTMQWRVPILADEWRSEWRSIVFLCLHDWSAACGPSPSTILCFYSSLALEDASARYRSKMKSCRDGSGLWEIPDTGVLLGRWRACFMVCVHHRMLLEVCQMDNC